METLIIGQAAAVWIGAIAGIFVFVWALLPGRKNKPVGILAAMACWGLALIANNANSSIYYPIIMFATVIITALYIGWGGRK